MPLKEKAISGSSEVSQSWMKLLNLKKPNMHAILGKNPQTYKNANT